MSRKIFLLAETVNRADPMVNAKKHSNGDGTTLEKVLSRSGISIMQLIAIIFAAGFFYAQNSSNQERNESRFQQFSKERDSQAEQMQKFEDIQSKTLIELSSLTERMNAQTDVIKDIRELLRPPTHR